MATVAGLLALAGRPGERNAGDDLRRDAEILLTHCLGKPRSYLFAWPEAVVAEEVAERYRELLARRRAGEPVAYLLGEREFWSLRLAVSPDTLIPRADTERLVEVALATDLPEDARVVDLGTGSGAIALALASERPCWQVTGVERSATALALARGNADRHGLNHVHWRQGDWFSPLDGERFDLVVSNPPYLAAGDPHLRRGDLRFEPRDALVAERGGMDAFDTIIGGAPRHLRAGGWLLFEHGCEQGAMLRERLRSAGFRAVQSWRDLAGLERVSGGEWRGDDHAQ